MESSSVTLRALQTCGIITSAVLAGTGATFTYAAVPTILKAPRDLLLQQWRTMFNAGFAVGPPMGALASLSLICAAGIKYSNFNDAAGLSSSAQYFYPGWQVDMVAALAPVSIMPFTLLIIQPVNRKLLAAAESGTSKNAASLSEREVQDLVKTWARLNGVRSWFPLIGAIVGLWSILK